MRIKLHNLTAKYNADNNDKYYEICDIEKPKCGKKETKRKEEKEKRERVRSSIK